MEELTWICSIGTVVGSAGATRARYISEHLGLDRGRDEGGGEDNDPNIHVDL